MGDDVSIENDSMATPIECIQHYYAKCRHSFRSPQPADRQPYRVVAYLDHGGVCPWCEGQTKNTKREKDSRP